MLTLTSAILYMDTSLCKSICIMFWILPKQVTKSEPGQIYLKPSTKAYGFKDLQEDY